VKEMRGRRRERRERRKERREGGRWVGTRERDVSPKKERGKEQEEAEVRRRKEVDEVLGGVVELLDNALNVIGRLEDLGLLRGVIANLHCLRLSSFEKLRATVSGLLGIARKGEGEEGEGGLEEEDQGYRAAALASERSAAWTSRSPARSVLSIPERGEAFVLSDNSSN